jgi:hypothetical protein
METAARSQRLPLARGAACGEAGPAAPRVPQPRCRQLRLGPPTTPPALRPTQRPPALAAARSQHRGCHTRAAAAAAEDSEAAEEDPSTAFDWRLGLALAGCAFEAYNEIEVDADAPGCLKMASMGGTEITFVDK